MKTIRTALMVLAAACGGGEGGALGDVCGCGNAVGVATCQVIAACQFGLACKGNPDTPRTCQLP